MMGGPNLLNSLWLGDIYTDDRQTLITLSVPDMCSETFMAPGLPPVALDCASCAALKAPAVGRLRVFKNVISNAQMS